MKNRKIRFKLIMMAVIVGLFPLILSNLLIHSHQKKVSTEVLKSKNLILASTIEAQLDDYVEDAELQIELLANELYVKDFLSGGTTTKAQVRQNFDARVPATLKALAFSDLMLIDGNGVIVVDYMASAVDEKRHSVGSLEQVKGALEGKTTWGPIVAGDQNGKKVISMSVATPVKVNDKVVGAINITATLDALNKIIHNGVTSIGDSADTFLIDKTGMLCSDTINAVSGKISAMEYVMDTVAAQNLKEGIASKNASFSGADVYKTYDGDKVLGSYNVVAMGDMYYGLILEVNEEEAFTDINSETKTMIALIAVFIVFDFFVSYYFTRGMARPIRSICKSAKEIADFDLKTEVEKDILLRKDEIGQVGQAIELIKDSLVSLVKKIDTTSEDVLQASLQLQNSAGQSSDATSEVANTIAEIARGASDQAETTVSGAEKLTKLGASVDDETVAIDRVGTQMEKVQTNVQDGMNIINDLYEKNQLSSEAVKVVQESIVQASECAQKISEASTFIASIASQTNLLSLNASIEAARAGEAGRGFSVVASEIQKLADQSTESTQTIDTIVAEIVKTVEKAVQKTIESVKILEAQTEIVQDVSDKFNLIAEATKESKTAVDELEKSSNVISKMNREVQEAVSGLAAIAQENAAATEETHAGVEEQSAMVQNISDESGHLAALAQELRDAIEMFKL